MYSSRETCSLWQRTDLPLLPSLASHESADVCVVGGGIAGLSAAYRFLEEGRSVALIDRGDLSLGESMRSTAHLTSVLDRRFFDLDRRHGAEGVRLAAESHAFAIDEIQRITHLEAIDCAFERVPGYLFLAPGHDTELLARELGACQEAGLANVEYLTAGLSPLFPTGPCLRFAGQARFHAGLYLTGLARAVQRRGGRVYAHTEATGFSGGEGPTRVQTNRGFQVTCEVLVLATHLPLGEGSLPSKLAPYRSYVVALPLAGERADPGLFWDTALPYHYVRTAETDEGEPLLLVGGADHRTGQATDSDPFEKLVEWARDRLGVRGPLRGQWSGQILEPHDGLAYIGRAPDQPQNALLVTGLSGNGLTYGVLAARLLADLAAGRDNPWASLYDPSRMNLGSMATILQENVRAVAPYADWLTKGDLASFAEIPAGEGAIVREGMQKLAVYRDPRGRPHFFSAVCPHRRGIVRWNSAEKTWDCPCHGSRFDCLGHPLNGPARTGLAAISDNLASEGDALSA